MSRDRRLRFGVTGGRRVVTTDLRSEREGVDRQGYTLAFCSLYNEEDGHPSRRALGQLALYKVPM